MTTQSILRDFRTLGRNHRRAEILNEQLAVELADLEGRHEALQDELQHHRDQVAILRTVELLQIAIKGAKDAEEEMQERETKVMIIVTSLVGVMLAVKHILRK